MTVAAATLRVGPSRPYATPCAAFAAASDGDIIEIDAEGTYDGDVCAIFRSNLTIRGVGGRPRINAAGRNAEGKGTWVVKGRNTVIENVELTGSAVPDRNGAAIRQEGQHLTVRDCYIHGNENGILTGNSGTSEILLEYTEFANNGFGDGQSHNIYVGREAKFTMRFCYSHRGRVGHLVKSRAAENYILYNRLTNETDGTASYELDLPNGGRSYVIGNLLQQGPATQNGTILAYRLEGAHDNNPSTQLFVINNTFVNERLTGTNNFISIQNAVTTPALIRNNIFVGPGTLSTQGGSVLAGNISSADPMFMSTQTRDYRLRFGSPAIDAGQDPGTGDGMPLTPVFAYIHPACGEGRRTVNGIDVGAYEFGGAAFNGDAPARCRQIDAGGVVNSANFLSGPVAPGSIFSIFGSNLATEEVGATAVPLPAMLAGASVTVNGIPAPLFFASPAQINAQVPFEVQPGPASAVVTVGGVATSPASFNVAPAAPAIFVWGANRAIAQNIVPGQLPTLNTPQNPVRAGGIITAYLTGQGAVTPSLATGAPAPVDRLLWSALPYSAAIGGRAANVRFLGLTPTAVGLLQADLDVPDLPAGDHSLVVTINGVASNAGLVSVSVP